MVEVSFTSTNDSKEYENVSIEIVRSKIQERGS